jgi:hypothetical protein
MFEDGANVIGVGTLNLSGTTMISAGSLAVGTHNIVAVYEGSGKYEGSTSNTIEQVIGPPPDIPVLETVRIPALTGATTTDRITSLSYSGVLFGQPADSIEFRLRIPWPSTLQVLVGGQQLQQIQIGSPPPQPDDAGYFTVSATPMPGWPDKIDPSAPGYNWFFVLANVKLPKQFRFVNAATSVPGFTITLRDVSLDGQLQAADVSLPVVPYPRPAFGSGVATPPSTFFISGENSKNDSILERARYGIVAGQPPDSDPDFVSTVTLAGWADKDSIQQRSNSQQLGGSGRSEDWHFDLHLDPDFIQRNYGTAMPPFSNIADPLASGVIPGQPEKQINPGGCHTIPLVVGTPDVGTFIMPGEGLLDVELNSWHTDGPRGSSLPPGWRMDKNASLGDPNFPDDSAISVPMNQCPDPTKPCAIYPNNAWAFDVLVGTTFPPFPLPPNDASHNGQIRAGDYLIVTGTLWEDIAHLDSTPDSNRLCWEDALACQGGWIEIHPVDVARFVSPAPALRKEPNLVTQCAWSGTGNFQSSIVGGPPNPFTDRPAVLKFQEIPDSRFTDPNTVTQKQIQSDPCDPTKIDVNLEVVNPNGFGRYKSVVEAWWEPVTNAVPPPNCPPATFSFIELSTTRLITPGASGSFGSSLSMQILKPDQTPLQTVTLSGPGPTLAPISNDQSFVLNSPVGISSLGNFVLALNQNNPNCILGFTCDLWQIQNISMRAFNTTDEQISSPKTQQLCLFNNGGSYDWQTLTKNSPNITLGAFTGCATLAPPQFSLPSGTYTCPQTVTLSDIDSGAVIVIGANGAPPTTQVPNPASITVSSSEVITAIAQDGTRTSVASTASYTCLAPPQCQAGLALCSGTCVNLQTNVGNCGTCDNACFAGQKCTNGNCLCPAGTSLCCGGDLGCRKPGSCPKLCP